MAPVDTDLQVPEDAPPVRLVEARWVGTSEAELPDKRLLVPGETVVEIPEPEAIASDNWEVVSDGSGKVTAADLRKEAKEIGAELPSRAKKDQIEAAIAKRREEIAAEEAAAAATSGDPESTDDGESNDEENQD
jgi:hypothetical protein